MDATDRIVLQDEAGVIGGTSNPTRLRLERRGHHPKRFQVSPNGRTGYLLSELLAWVAERAANRDPTDKTAAGLEVLTRRRAAALVERRRVSGESMAASRRGRRRQSAELAGPGTQGLAGDEAA
jgi:predicted DNA-binding transcriptional regulator AlpA